MARKAREKSPIGIYNVMLRGNGQLFCNEEDYDEFIDRLAMYFMDDAKIFAYCLMENAVCMVIKESEKGISRDMKPFTTSYARYFNGAYEKTGDVFADRFKSEAIADKNGVCDAIVMTHNLYELLGADAYTGDEDLLDGNGLCDAKSAFAYFGSKSKYVMAMNSDDIVLSGFYNVLK